MKEIVCSVIVLLGIDLSVSSITSDLKSYKDNNINRYVIRDELLGNILDDYFDVIIVGEVSEITKSVRGSIQNVAWTKCRTKYVKPLVHR